MRTTRFQLGKLPLEVLEDSFGFIRDFSTFFVIRGMLAGSGTFVRLNGIAGILTAHHVWDGIVESGEKEVGMQISYRTHRFTIPVNLLVPLYGLRGESEAFGPDVVFIKIPLAKLGAITARKSFYNLDVRRGERHSKSKNRYGLCIVTGAPADRARSYQGKPLTVFVLGSILGRTRTRRIGGFDFWELKTLSRNDDGQPESFEGMSGGGVWKVILEKKYRARLTTAKVTGVFLGGVAFYQSDLKGDWRFLRAHGPLTIYKKLCRLPKDSTGP